MVKLNPSSLLSAASLITLAIAHPGEHEHHDAEAIAKQLEHAARIKRGLAACEGNPNYVALQKRAMQRRAEKARRLREKRGLDQELPYKLRRRDQASLETFEGVNHNMTGSGYNADSSHDTLFASYKNSSCILTPEVTYGPYYVTGEYYRSDVTEDQTGVPVEIEYQYIDVSTCSAPASTIYIETWSVNATGVYAGVQASGNGNADDAANLNRTFQRGVTKVGSDGVGEFSVIFPGHYTGRTTHTHIMTHLDGTVYANNTFKSSNILHVGQLFYDDDLITAIEALSPYNTNTQTRTMNADDSIAQQAADNSYDPFPDWTMLGDSLDDGLLMWISVGIDMNASYTASPAAILTENGGVAQSNSMGGSSGGPGGSNGTMSGSPPNGTMGSPPNGTSGGAAPSGAMPSNGTGSVVGGTSGSASGSAGAAASSSAASSKASTTVSKASMSKVATALIVASAASALTLTTGQASSSATKATAAATSSGKAASSASHSGKSTGSQSAHRSTATGKATQTQQGKGISAKSSATKDAAKDHSTAHAASGGPAKTPTKLSTKARATTAARADPSASGKHSSQTKKSSSTKKAGSSRTSSRKTSTSSHHQSQAQPTGQH